jgi:hypothetical protein
MQRSSPLRDRTPLVFALVVAVLPLSAAGSSRPSRKSPHVEISGEARVATAPRETVHENGRKFLEFEITLVKAAPTAEQPTGADAHLSLDMKGRVRVVHDLSCGGSTLALAEGDRIEFQGEYVHVPKGGDLIHFTHPADGSCGSSSKHPGGYIRKLPPPAAAKPAPTPLKPSALIPDQPYTGPPPPKSQRPYSAIITAKEKGATNAELLAKVEREGIAYFLTTPEIQQLRAAGVSQDVIEAMLRAGRAMTPGPAVSPTPR